MSDTVTPRLVGDAAWIVRPSRFETPVDHSAFGRIPATHHQPRRALHASFRRHTAPRTSLPLQSLCSTLCLWNNTLCTSITGWRYNHHPNQFFSSCRGGAFCSSFCASCTRRATGSLFSLGRIVSAAGTRFVSGGRRAVRGAWVCHIFFLFVDRFSASQLECLSAYERDN